MCCEGVRLTGEHDNGADVVRDDHEPERLDCGFLLQLGAVKRALGDDVALRRAVRSAHLRHVTTPCTMRQQT